MEKENRGPWVFWAAVAIAIATVICCGLVLLTWGSQNLHADIPTYTCVCTFDMYNCSETWSWAANCTTGTNITVASCTGDMVATSSQSCTHDQGIIFTCFGILICVGMLMLFCCIVAASHTRWRRAEYITM